MYWDIRFVCYISGGVSWVYEWQENMDGIISPGKYVDRRLEILDWVILKGVLVNCIS